MFDRQMQDQLHRAAKQYPVVTLTGPRQSGKTTLAKETFPDKPYIDLEAMHVLDLVQDDPVGFLDQYPDGAIIDEIQCYPQLLSEIRVRVDASGIKGMFILTGSYQVGLKGAVAQSLAGRTAILHLLPMSIAELNAASLGLDTNTLLFKGGFPRVYRESLDVRQVYSGYTQTYLQRDLLQMTAVKDLHLFQKFIRLCAGRIGQLFNKDALASEVGISSGTVTNWLSILEASYIVFLLQPYHENFGKRVIKSPKLYFCDVGLASYLLGIENPNQLARDPLRGALFENLVILELVKARWNQGLDHKLFFYRDSNQQEVDILFQSGHQLLPIEIKSSKTYHPSFGKGIRHFQSVVGDRAVKPCIVYAGDMEQQVKDIRLLHYTNASAALSIQEDI